MSLWLWMDTTFRIRNSWKVDINKCLSKHVISIIITNYIIVLNKHIMVMMNRHIGSFNITTCQMIINWFKFYKLKTFKFNK